MEDNINYSQVPFVSKPSYLRHPDHLSMIGKLFGLPTKNASSSRVLEIGCGDGSNIIPFALNNQGAQVLGIDFSSRQVANGNEIIKRLNISNVKLQEMDILTWQEPSLAFDYIICHGLFSWSLKIVQNKILEIIATNLAPLGVALLSYNCLPGWEVRAAIREIVRNFDRENDNLPVAERILVVRNFLKNYQETPLTRIRYHRRQVEKEITNILQQSDGYLFYELLGEDTEAFYVSEVIKRASENNLEYLGDSKYSRTGYYEVITNIDNSVGSEQIGLAEEESDSRRPFAYRESLFCRQGARQERRLNAYCFKNFSFSSSLVPLTDNNITDEFFLPSGHKYKVSSSQLKEVVNILYKHWPQAVSFAEIAKTIGIGEEEQNKLCFELLKLFKDDILDVYEVSPSFSKEITDYPAIMPFALIQLEKQNWATNYRHEYLEFSEEERAIARCFNGEKSISEISVDISTLKLSDELDGVRIRQTLEMLRDGAFLKF